MSSNEDEKQAAETLATLLGGLTSGACTKRRDIRMEQNGDRM
jgi:hypothetical protein